MGAAWMGGVGVEVGGWRRVAYMSTVNVWGGLMLFQRQRNVTTFIHVMRWATLQWATFQVDMHFPMGTSESPKSFSGDERQEILEKVLRASKIFL